MIVTRREAVELIERSIQSNVILEDSDLEIVVFAANEDVQVRDWLMGLPIKHGISESIDWLTKIASKLTMEDSVPFLAVQASLHYENNETDKAKSVLKYVKNVNPEYTLAILLTRVFDSKWPGESFTMMRRELQPMVVEACLGEEGDVQIGV